MPLNLQGHGKIRPGGSMEVDNGSPSGRSGPARIYISGNGKRDAMHLDSSSVSSVVNGFICKGDDDDDDDDDNDDDETTALFETESLRGRFNSEMEELIVDSFDEHYTEGWKMKACTSSLKIFAGIALVLFTLWAMQSSFPSIKTGIMNFASWASQTGELGTLAFTLSLALLLLIPGVPGTLLCFTCGSVFPFGRALFVAAVGHQLGSCLAFSFSRYCCRTRFEKLLLARPTLRTMSTAAKVEQWKVAFLSRFIVMPVQVKNYLFGVLPVSFRCFALMAFLGDFQSTLFSVYLGSLSQSALSSQKDNDDNDDSNLVVGVVKLDDGNFDIQTNGSVAGWLPLASLVLAFIMTTVASFVARRAYLKVLQDIKTGRSATQGITLQEKYSVATTSAV